jgi:tetratricopeptide (TPR) repeat protein
LAGEIAYGADAACAAPVPACDHPALGHSMTKANFWSAISLGDAFVQSGRKDEAAIWFRKALAADSADVDAACGLVTLLLDQRFLAEAIETLECCLRRNPFNLRLLAQQRRIGLALYDEKLWEDAEPWLQKALELEPWDVTLVNAYSRVRGQANLRDDAVSNIPKDN